jgi:hypothetical protein
VDIGRRTDWGRIRKCEARGRLGKRLVMRARACVPNRSHENTRRGENRVDPAPLAEPPTYRRTGRCWHRGTDRIRK